MTIRETGHDEEAFARRAWAEALDNLATERRGGAVISDEGDFVARAVDQLYMERAGEEGGRRG